MTRRTLILLAAALGLVITAGVPGAGADGTDLVARMTGAAEAPGPGDPDGRGRAWLSEEDGQACYSITWRDIGAPTAAHIHRGKPGVAGPVVETLFDTRQSGRRAEDCTTDYDAELVAAVIANPGDYYVNVHNEAYPGGAIRGQLREL